MPLSQFIGREDELNVLETKYRSPNGQLVVLYGRRRIGKTETLRKFCEGKEHVFFSCTECTDEQQLRAFSSRLLAKGIPASRYVESFSNWEQALGSVSELPFRGKRLLVIDEFPYMVKSNPSIPSILQNLWDIRLKNDNVMIILCGSAMSFLEKEVLAEKNPLYGRATGILKINAMGFYDAIRFFPDYSSADKVMAYAVLGGIPHYLKQFDQRRTLEDNIKQSILHRGSILYSEVEFLIRQELRETTVYNTIIGAVALGNTKLNGIFQKTQIDRSKLTVYLRKLVDLGIVRREFPVSDSIKEQANVQRGLYQITDNFFRFWYAFVFPNMSELEAGDVDGIYNNAIQPVLEQYASRVYEDVCREYLRRMNRQDSLPFRFTEIGSWWNKDSEIDIVAADHGKSRFLVGECKFKTAPSGLSDLNAMLAKPGPGGKTAKTHYYLFSKSGFTGAAREMAKERGIHLVQLDEMV